MPGKSRRSKGKHPHLSKKSRAKLRDTTSLKQPAVTESPQPAAAISAPPAPVKTAATAKPGVVQYPYIANELRTIGILGGIVLVILVVLALVLS